MVRLLPLVGWLLAAALAFAQTPAHSGEPPGWIQAEATGCKLWNANPKHGATVSWSGACVDGFAERMGVQQWFLEGEPAGRYEGNMHSGKLSGFGVYMWPSGSRYEGQWLGNSQHGHGIYFYFDGRRYEGEWRNGHRNGRGVLNTSAGRYDGEWRDDNLHGHAAATWSNGNHYEGEWRDDRVTGPGIYTWADGDRFEGEFKDGKRTGRGIYTWANGDRYEGEFKDDKRTGRGVYTPANRDRGTGRKAARRTGNFPISYDGDFVDGEFHGVGIMLFSNGAWYKGEWRNGHPNGLGTMQLADGRTFAGTWRDGCMRQGKYIASLGASEAQCKARLSE